MGIDFDWEINRSVTNDIKWRPEGLKGYLPIKVRDDMIPMWIADMDFACPPCVVEAIQERAGQEIFGYCAPRPNYFAALAYWYKEHYNMVLQPEWLSRVPTVVAGINMAIRAFSNPGDHVIIQQPVYEPFAGLIKQTDRIMVNNALICTDGYYTMNYELLEQQAADPKAKILVLCSPHNPVGRVWKKEELSRLGDICKRHGVLVVSDEIHSEIVYAGHSHTPFPMASDAPSILCTSPGKTFNVAGLRIANIFLPDAEMKKAYDAQVSSVSMNGGTTFGLEAVTAAYSPAGADWLSQLLEYLQQNVTIVSEWVQTVPGASMTRPEGTFLCWLNLEGTGLTDDEILQKIDIDAGVVCVPGPWFGVGGAKHLRLNIGCTKKNLKLALERISEALK